MNPNYFYQSSYELTDAGYGVYKNVSINVLSCVLFCMILDDNIKDHELTVKVDFVQIKSKVEVDCS